MVWVDVAGWLGAGVKLGEEKIFGGNANKLTILLAVLFH